MAIKVFGRKETTPYTGTASNDTITANDLGVVITGGGSAAGDASVAGDTYFVGKDSTINGGEGNDTFVINKAVGAAVLHGGTSMRDFDGNVAANATGGSTLALSRVSSTDTRLTVATRPGASSIDTNATTVAGYNAVDTIEFKKSGDYTELQFDGIERIELADGVTIKLSADVFEQNGNSTDRGFLNPGFMLAGTAGGKTESVIVVAEYAENTFTPASFVVGGSPKDYLMADFQLDDYSVANLFSNVKVTYDMRGDDEGDSESEEELESYARVDGSNNDEIVIGSDGVDNATMRLGDDTYYGRDGNDLLIGHGGADYLDGGAGDDIFVIGGFGSGISGTSSKADDGAKEWIATGAKFDVIVGGEGVDTLRITTGIGANTKANGTVVLNDANFKSMEVVQVGGTVGRLNVEDSALQLINDHFYFNTSGKVTDTLDSAGNNGGTINNVVVDASGVTKNGLRFEGNGDNNTFIGTTKADTFVGNGGNDTLTGGLGADKFVFGKVHTMTAKGAAGAAAVPTATPPKAEVPGEPQAYADVATNITSLDKDTITDFNRAQGDKIVLNRDMFSVFTKATGVTAANVVSGAGAVAADANDYLIFNSTNNTLSYDADGSGAGAAIEIAVLTGVTSLQASDFIIG